MKDLLSLYHVVLITLPMSKGSCIGNFNERLRGKTKMEIYRLGKCSIPILYKFKYRSRRVLITLIYRVIFLS